MAATAGDAVELTRTLGRFAADLSYDALPASVRERARMSLLDGLAVMLGAVAFNRHTGDTRLDRYLDAAAAGDGRATVVGCGRRASPMIAAFANGTLSEVLDFSDCILTARNHPGATVIPAALAVAEARQVSGRALMTAVMAAYEVHTRLCHAIQPSHWYRGFQATGTIGTSGAAVAAGKIIGLDAAGMADALGISGFIMPVSNGDNVFRGHSVKPVHGGQGATCGVSAALLAASGFSSGPLEGQPPRHHAALPILSDQVDAARALAELGGDWRCLELAYKPYPIGLLNIGPVEIALDVRAAHRLDPDRIERIEGRTYKDAAHFVGKYTTPQSSYIDCYLSLQYCVAVALYDGRLTVDQLESKRVSDPKVHALARRIVLTEDPAMSAMYPHQWPIELTFRLTDGSSIVRRVDSVKWSPRRPPSWAELSEKFMDQAVPAIGAERARRTVDFVAALDDAADVAPLLRLVA